jgi:hypothetical protein
MTLTELLQTFSAWLTMTTGFDETTNAHPVTDLVMLGQITGLGDLSHDLVAWDHGEEAPAPLVPYLVEVRVTDPAIEYVDDHIVRARFLAFDLVRTQKGFGF